MRQRPLPETALIVSVVLWAFGGAVAADRYWVGGSGDWGEAANWAETAGGPGGTGVPGEGDTVYLRQSDDISRVVTYGELPPVPTLSRLAIDASGSGSATLEISDGQLQLSSGLTLGYYGAGTIVQRGGAVGADAASIGFGTYGATKPSSYTLEDGHLTTRVTQIGDSSGPASQFVQMGGTHTVAQLGLYGGSYELLDGDLAVTGESWLMGLFRQEGGTHSTPFLRLFRAGGVYEWTGGELNVTAGLTVRDIDSPPSPLPFVFPSTPRTLAINGIVDIGSHSFTNADKISLALGPQSLLIVNAGYDPASEFGSFTHEGLTHIYGTTLTVAPDHTIAGAGIITDPAEVYGNLSGASGTAIYLKGPVHVYPGAVLEGVRIQTASNQAAIVDGGSISGGSIEIGGSSPGTLRQTGGTINNGMVQVKGGMSTAQTTLYELQDGELITNYLSISSSSGPAKFLQSGGAISVPGWPAGGGLTISNGGKAAAYEIAGGSLSVTKLNVAVSGDGGLFSITSPVAEVRVSDYVWLGTKGEVQAVPGAAIHMDGGRWFSTSQHPELLQDLVNIALIFEGNADVAKAMEVGGLDLGAVLAGYDTNFALGTLRVGGAGGTGWVYLRDNAENSLADSNPEALYVEHLVVNAGSTLDLNGYHLYALTMENLGGTILGGEVLIVPEPAAASLLLIVLTAACGKRGQCRP